MRKFFFIIISCLILFSVTPVLASNGENQLPTRLTYAKEWLHLNLLTWKYESKVKVLDDLATKRVANIKTAAQSGTESDITALTGRYLQIKERESIAIKKRNISADTVNMVVDRELERQRTLSLVRQETKSETIKNQIAKVQEEAVTKTKSALKKNSGNEKIDKFNDNIVAAWRDPGKKIDSSKEKTTRVYAAGTSENGTIDEGVIIDGGQAKIVTESNQLKIEYAPGIGPNSVTGDNGKKLWKIVQSDGTVIESYTAGGNVVIGKSSGISSNVVVNTVAGGTSGMTNVVAGNSGGIANTVVVGGKSVVTVENSGNPTGTQNTVNNSTNTVNQSSPAGSTGGQTVQQVAP